MDNITEYTTPESPCTHPHCILRHPHTRGAVLRGVEPGIVPVEELSDRAIAEETLFWLRTAGQALAQFQKMGPGAMLKAALSGKGKD